MANVTGGQNNMSDIIENNKYTKYKGVRKRKWGKWVSEVRLPNSRERIWLGSFDTAEKAARAFDAAQFCLRGRCAQFNFPHDPPAIPGGESLSPHEIQAVAARFANETSNNICTDHPEATDHHHYDYMVVDQSNESPNHEEKSQNPICYEGETDWSFLKCLDDDHGSAGTAANYGNSNNNNYESFDSLFYDNQMHYSGHEFFNPAATAPQDSDFAGGECHYNGDDSISQQQYSSFLWNF